MSDRARRIKDWLEGKKRSPCRLKIMPTSMDQCNLSCVYCRRNFADIIRKNEISTKRYLEIIDEAANIGTKSVELVGLGEPMLNQDIMKILRKIKENGMEGFLTTNGTLFNADNVKEFLSIEWDLITISIDGPDAKTQDSLRPRVDSGSSFCDIIRGLKLFNELKDNDELPKISFVPVLNDKNFDKAPEFIQLASEFNIQTVDFKPLVTFDEKKVEQFRITRPDDIIDKVVEETQRLSDKLDIETNIREFKSKQFTENSGNIIDSIQDNINEKDIQTNLLQVPCFNPWLVVQIFPEEKTANPCLTYSDYGVNVIENNLEEIWYGDKFSEIRKRLKNGEIPDFCKDCCEGNVLKNREIIKNVRREFSH